MNLKHRGADNTLAGSREMGRLMRLQDWSATPLGAGIDPASAWQIVTLHGGTIRVSSREGAGSTFTVSLPLSAKER